MPDDDFNKMIPDVTIEQANELNASSTELFHFVELDGGLQAGEVGDDEEDSDNLSD